MIGGPLTGAGRGSQEKMSESQTDAGPNNIQTLEFHRLNVIENLKL